MVGFKVVSLVLTVLTATTSFAFIVPVSTLSRPVARSSSPVMSIAVFGASGLLGSEVVYQALAKGEKVIAFSRDPSKLVTPAGSGGSKAGSPINDSNLVRIAGTVTSQADVDKAFADGDVTGVVIALGGKTKDVGPTMLTDGTRCIINAMKKAGTRRVAVVTSIGAGDSEQQAPFFFKVLMFTVMSSIFKDKNNQEALFTKGPGSDLEYTIVRPGGLTVEPPTGVVNIIAGEAGSIPRADVASFCISAALDPDFAYIKQAPCISSVGGTSWTKDRSAAARGGMA